MKYVFRETVKREIKPSDIYCEAKAADQIRYLLGQVWKIVAFRIPGPYENYISVAGTILRNAAVEWPERPKDQPRFIVEQLVMSDPLKIWWE